MTSMYMQKIEYKRQRKWFSILCDERSRISYLIPRFYTYPI
ncbi:hypothetical protein LEP1GSC194_1152 [Leptospira alstonii serovar Sichuan str. 79601]|uniref:Uncharacterized protein n=1 Tax=Leptospira alstonii serovar Sichuan str. 79601 TaxID=1218565 RepID=M6CIP6_9LEPT|nr:hypothetical protein LEP1GSC194_1152 [Leptospira alstonii serovar Sichuan str. 79601]